MKNTVKVTGFDADDTLCVNEAFFRFRKSLKF